MSNKRPATVADLASFDAIVDARSPAEYALDHIPGAINCPVLDDDERRIVGTLYKQQGAFEARRVGGAMVAANLARHLREHFADKPAKWKPLIYCWRGGMRSGSMVTWLRLVGWDAQQLAGGYKRWRQHVVELIDTLAPTLPLRELSGPTGSAKTRVLQALAELGEQVLDLEEYAAHKGSVLGDLPGIPQPSQKQFETRIAAALGGFDLSRTIFIEAESRKIGRLMLPTSLLTRLRESPCIEIDATPAARLAYLLRDYAYLGDEPAALAAKLARLSELQSRETLGRWIGWAESRELAPLFAELMALHYDPHYARSQGTHLAGFASAERIAVGDLSESGIKRLAQEIEMQFGCGKAAM